MYLRNIFISRAGSSKKVTLRNEGSDIVHLISAFLFLKGIIQLTNIFYLQNLIMRMNKLKTEKYSDTTVKNKCVNVLQIDSFLFSPPQLICNE